MAIKKFCAKAGCSNLCEIDQKYCSVHSYLELQLKSQRHKDYDQSIRHKRDKQVTEFYHSREWLAVRLQALIRDHYLCQECFRQKKITPADMVHHKKPVKPYWHLRLVASNLESLCNSCHNRMDHEG